MCTLINVAYRPQYPMYTQCIPNVYPMYTQCIPNVYPMYTQCIPNVYPMYTQYMYTVMVYVRSQPVRARMVLRISETFYSSIYLFL